MTTEDDKDWSTDLEAIEDRIGGRESPATCAPVMRDLSDKIADEFPGSPGALRLRASCSIAVANPKHSRVWPAPAEADRPAEPRRASDSRREIAVVSWVAERSRSRHHAQHSSRPSLSLI